MKIGIVLNDVLREFTGQLEYTVNKYHRYGREDKFSIDDNPIENFDLVKYFKFNDKKELNTFLYEEASLEIFGHAGEIKEGLMRMFNTFLMDIEDDEEHEVYLISREVGFSIPATFFYLSKTTCKAKNIKFYHNYDEQWGLVDILVTANPIAIESKPEGKIVVKINTTYNKDVESDYELDCVDEFFTNEELRNNILNNN